LRLPLQRLMQPHSLALVVLLGMLLGPWSALFGPIGPAPAAAQPMARVHAHPSTRAVAVGERFTLSIVAEHSFQTHILFPSSDPLLFGPLEVIDRSAPASRYLGAARPGAKIDSVAYTVAAFGIDSVRIPSLPVRVVAPAGTLTVGTSPQSIRIVSTVGPDAKGLRDLAPLASFPQPLWPWLVLLGVGILALAAAGYAWRRWRHGTPVEARPDADDSTPYEMATARLQRLSAYDLDAPEACRPYYINLAALVREYLAARLDVKAPKRTTREAIAHLRRRSDVPGDAVAHIQTVLEHADLVKFADNRPSPATMLQDRRDAKAAIDHIERAWSRTSGASAEAAPNGSPDAPASDGSAPGASDPNGPASIGASAYPSALSNPPADAPPSSDPASTSRS
jgi:hypothetical protein